MLVGHGNNGVLLIGLVREDVETLTADLSLTFEQSKQPFLTKTIMVVYDDTRPALIERLKQAGVAVSEQMRQDYLAGKRTDTPSKPS